MFWDHVLVRLHFGFGPVPGGMDSLGQILSTAYAPQWRRFAVFPPGPARPLPLLEPFSVWLLTQDCPISQLRTHAQQRYNDLLRSPPAGLNVAALPAQLTSRGPADATPFLTQAQQLPYDVLQEVAALLAIGPDYRRRMCEFRARVRLQAPGVLLPGVVSEFAHLWRQFYGSKHDPVNFPLAWFRHDVVECLTNWPAPSPHFTWATRPTWIDEMEWRFLKCCYNGGVLTDIDRLALFLLVYGGLTVPQITRLFVLLRSQTNWSYPRNDAGHAAVMSHLVGRFVPIIPKM